MLEQHDAIKLLANCNGLIVGWDPTPSAKAVFAAVRRRSQLSTQDIELGGLFG